MDQKGKEMIQGWIKMHRGNREEVALYIARTLKVCGLKQARQIVAEAARS